METQTLMICVALIAGLGRMPALNIFKICAGNVGTMKVDPWRIRSSAAVERVSQSLRTWFAGLWSRRVVFACAAVILALLVSHLGASHELVAVAVSPALLTLRADRVRLLAEAEAFRKDGTFADEQARTSFDAKMAEVDGVDVKIRAAEVADAPTTTTTTVTTEVRAQILADERARTSGIELAVRVAGLDAAFGADLVKRGVTLDAARVEIFTKMAERSNKNPTSGLQIVGGEDAKDKFMRGAENWLMHKAGTIPMIVKATGQKASEFDPGEFRGMTLLDLAKTCLDHAGVATRGLDKMAVASKAFMLRGDISQSVADFTVLLENVLGKVLQAAYVTQPDTWRSFCNTSTVSDFRAHNRYRFGAFGALDSLNETGEFATKAISDAEKGTITAATKGNIINVSRQMIVNDDMGAFARLVSMLGRAAALSVETDVYALLAQNSGLGPTMLDGNTLFHATHNNITTGAAISAAAIDLDRVALASQKDPNGNDFIDVRPSVLLIAVGLGGQARVINQSQYDPDNLASGSKATMRPNIAVGLFRSITDTPRLSGTRRYIFGDPSIVPTLEVAYLEGADAPVIETQNGWRTDGAEMRVRFDYGVAAVDFRGAVTNAGV